MPTDNTGVQTRAMAQCTDGKPQETQNQNVNPTVELYKSKDKSIKDIKDFVRKHGTIALDWYVPNFSNTRVGDLIEQRLPIETTDGRILFSCPTLSEFFRTSNFELDLRTGQVFSYLSPPKKHRNLMPERPLRPRIPTQHASGRRAAWHKKRVWKEFQTSKNWQDQQT